MGWEFFKREARERWEGGGASLSPFPSYSAILLLSLSFSHLLPSTRKRWRERKLVRGRRKEVKR
jgi:hypothetical protein